MLTDLFLVLNLKNDAYAIYFVDDVAADYLISNTKNFSVVPELRISPNPAHNYLNFEIDNTVLIDHLEVRSINGSLMRIAYDEK